MPRIGEPSGAGAWCVGEMQQRRRPMDSGEGSAPSQQKRGHTECLDRQSGVHPAFEPKLERMIISTDQRDRDVWPPVLQLVAMLCRTT